MTPDVPAKPLVFVFAGDYAQARYHAQRLGLTHWRYVDRAGDLLGAHRATLVRVGLWYHRPDKGEVNDVARQSEMTFVDPA